MKVGYVRISNEKVQDAASQRKLLADMGVEQERIFEDHGSGAVEPKKRTEYQKLILFLDNHAGEVDELIFSEYSRLGRSVVESLMELLTLMKSNIKISSLSKHENMINNIPPTWQPAVLSLMLGAAQNERDHIKERVRWGMENAKANGTKSGKKIGRPEVPIDMQKIKDIMVKYNLKEAQAIRVAEIKPSTFYAKKKKLVNHATDNNVS
jgi:DNA invertase Pin-like site-specific DNA recombinase